MTETLLLACVGAILLLAAAVAAGVMVLVRHSSKQLKESHENNSLIRVWMERREAEDAKFRERMFVDLSRAHTEAMVTNTECTKALLSASSGVIRPHLISKQWDAVKAQADSNTINGAASEVFSTLSGGMSPQGNGFSYRGHPTTPMWGKEPDQ